MCHFLFVIDHTHHRSKVSRTFSWKKEIHYTYFVCSYRNSWPVTPYIKSIGYWVSMCYCLVFYCILEGTTERHRLTQTSTDQHRPAQTGTDLHKTYVLYYLGPIGSLRDHLGPLGTIMDHKNVLFNTVKAN